MSEEVVVELLKDLEVKISQADMYMKKAPSAENKDLYRKVLNEAIRLIEKAHYSEAAERREVSD